MFKQFRTKANKKDVTFQFEQTLDGNLMKLVDQLLSYIFKIAIILTEKINKRFNTQFKSVTIWAFSMFFVLFQNTSLSHPIELMIAVIVYIKGCIYCATHDATKIKTVEPDMIFDKDGNPIN